MTPGAKSEASARHFFDRVARRYDRVYALSGELSRARMRRVLAAIVGRRDVLVLGIGTGRELPSLLDAGHTPTGLDVSPKMIAICEERARRVPIVETDFWGPLPFDGASFDAVLALHGTIAHPPRPSAHGDLAREIARVLRPPGVFVAEVPSSKGLERMVATDSDADIRVEITGATSFVHHDAVAGLSIAGVALDAKGWQDAVGPALDAKVEPLGDAEYLLVATRSVERSQE